MEEQKVGCVVMAAGNGARYGGNKLTVRLHGRSLIDRALDAASSPQFCQVVVVTQYPDVEALAEARGFQSLHNPHPDWGLSHTIRLGTEALRDCGGILYLVSDQPLLTRRTIERIITQWRQDPTRIVGAAHNGRRGNPCLFPREYFPELCALNGDQGGTVVIRAHPERLILVETSGDELSDVDTPEALRTLANRPVTSSHKASPSKEGHTAAPRPAGNRRQPPPGPSEWR